MWSPIQGHHTTDAGAYDLLLRHSSLLSGRMLSKIAEVPRRVSLRREMTEKRFKHLRWREKRPPMLPFESYVLLEKVAHAPAGKTAQPETADITASALLPQRQPLGRRPIPSEAETHMHWQSVTAPHASWEDWAFDHFRY